MKYRNKNLVKIFYMNKSDNYNNKIFFSKKI